MAETSELDRRLLRALRARPAHAYALARDLADEGGPDRATVYRRLAALERAGLVSARREKGEGPGRRVLSPTAAGREALRAELREAVRLLLEAHAASLPRGGGGGGRVEPPIVFVSGSRISGVEHRIVRSLARSFPRQVHLVVPPGVDAQVQGGSVLEAPWSSLPFRAAFARTLFVNEVPPAGGLDRAVREWARVLAPGGRLHVIAPAPLPRGVDPFVDFFAQLQGELFPDQAGSPDPAAVTAALRRAFPRVAARREADQWVWSAGAPARRLR